VISIHFVFPTIAKLRLSSTATLRFGVRVYCALSIGCTFSFCSISLLPPYHIVGTIVLAGQIANLAATKYQKHDVITYSSPPLHLVRRRVPNSVPQIQQQPSQRRYGYPRSMASSLHSHSVATNIPRFGEDKSGRWPKNPNDHGKTEIPYCYENKAAKDELETLIGRGWGIWQRYIGHYGPESGHSLIFARRLVPGQNWYCYLENGEWNPQFPADIVVIKRGAPGGWATSSSLGYDPTGETGRHYLSIGDVEQAPSRDRAWGKWSNNPQPFECANK
jgi:hypothetical protein